SGKNYLITGCDISTGDDNIVILTHAAKDWSKPVCENFIIRDCTFGEGHGMSIGSHTGGGVRGVLVENCAFDGTTAAIRMKSRRDNGGLVENFTHLYPNPNNILKSDNLPCVRPPAPIAPARQRASVSALRPVRPKNAHRNHASGSSTRRRFFPRSRGSYKANTVRPERRNSSMNATFPRTCDE
ncbi:MAG: hypothetical protein LBM04_08930, partial [Opitutaceae bacterium]|nr:hypothetical protein [Opitutaceae bacterium]